jgi:hypothetical protein
MAFVARETQAGSQAWLFCSFRVKRKGIWTSLRLVLRRNLFKSQRSIVEHSRFEIAARSKDMPLPIGLQGVGDPWRRIRTAFVAPQVTSRKPPAVTANMISDQK